MVENAHCLGVVVAFSVEYNAQSGGRFPPRLHACMTETQAEVLVETGVSVICRVGDFCVLRFYISIYRYGFSLSVYSTLRRILAAVSQTTSFTCCNFY